MRESSSSVDQGTAGMMAGGRFDASLSFAHLCSAVCRKLNIEPNQMGDIQG